MDLLKHGESAYPADAWVEQQYMKEDAFTAVSTAWELHTGRLLLLWASLLTYCLRPSSLQLFWDHLYSTGTTTVSKTAVFIRNIPSLTMAFSFVWCFPFHAQLSAFSTKIYHTSLGYMNKLISFSLKSISDALFIFFFKCKSRMFFGFLNSVLK